MTDESDKVESWLNKPRRIIHNQKIILTLLSLALPASLTLVTLTLWATTIFPETIAAILTAWAITTAGYITILVLRRTKK